MKTIFFLFLFSASLFATPEIMKIHWSKGVKINNGPGTCIFCHDVLAIPRKSFAWSGYRMTPDGTKYCGECHK